MSDNNMRWLIERYHSEPVRHGVKTLRRHLRAALRVAKTWPAIALMLALALLLSFYAVVATGAKRAEQQRLQDSQRAQALWRCNSMPLELRRECQANVISTPARAAQRPPARPMQVADLRP